MVGVDPVRLAQHCCCLEIVWQDEDEDEAHRDEKTAVGMVDPVQLTD